MVDKTKTDELMSELAQFLARMREELARSDYIFDSPQSQYVLQPPLPNASLLITEMETYFGSFPYAVASFFTIVGSVDFCGHATAFDELDYPDPIQIGFDYGYSGFMQYSTDPKEKEWWDEGYGGFTFLIAADYYHKEGVSGGPGYGFALPSAADDPLLTNTPYWLTFLNYLALSLNYAGFPGHSTGGLGLPPYFRDVSLVRESQDLSARFTNLANRYAS